MVATPTQAPPLRSHLSESLKSLPGSSQLSLYTLITPARKHIGLFPYTSLSQSSPLRSKILQQEFLILVAQSPVEDATQSVFVSGIEAVLYSIPCNSSSILYISKVDSTGQTVAGCGSPTRPLVKALIDYFVSPITRPTRNMRVQLFARAQNQYLFPDSSLHMEKRVLTDVKLCRWWKDVLTNISVTTEEFWERMGFRQECTLNAVTGFFVVDHLLDASPSPPVNDNASPSEVAARGTVPTAMLARISSSLQNLDFGSTERAIEATKVLTESIKGLCAGLGSGGSGGSEDDFYGEHVPTSMIVRNPPRLMKVTNSNMTQKNGEASGDGVQTPAPVQVNVLQARKKKRPAVTG
ncbi:hypothetical protein FRB98_008293 [Tulasnella sp. 332]|nr:hypothetical protein FRB98_008293 [Tulasnella sp. 332]